MQSERQSNKSVGRAANGEWYRHCLQLYLWALENEPYLKQHFLKEGEAFLRGLRHFSRGGKNTAAASEHAVLEQAFSLNSLPKLMM